MRTNIRKSMNSTKWTLVIAAFALLLLTPGLLFAGNKKKEQPKEAPTVNPDPLEYYDLSKIVWPNPPAITRIRFMTQFTGEKKQIAEANAQAKKSKWMDRLAGVTQDSQPQFKKRFMLGQPFGVGVDSKGLVYVADQKVGAIFIFNTETREVEFIKHGAQGNFPMMTGLTIDDADRIFVADVQLHNVQVFDKGHNIVARIREGLDQPVGLAVDNENRFLYVADSAMDQVFVYDLDNFKLIRKIGTAGKNHTSTAPGDFSRPVGVAVDSEGNLYVTDTFNTRVEVFDADGNFIRTWGKNGDGPGYFARPKGIAVDCDDHIWVVDSMQNRVQVYDKEGQLLIWFGGTGLRPGEMMVPVGIAIDKNNRVFTTDQYQGRLQMFRYVTQAEAIAEKKRRDDEDAKKNAGRSPTTTPVATPAEAPAKPAAEVPQQKESAPAVQAKPSGSK